MGKIAQDLLGEMQDFLSTLGEPARSFVAGIDWDMEERPLASAPLACLRHLDACAAIADAATEPMARLLAERGARLAWGQTYGPADFGQAFVDNYGWVELFGTRGHFVNDRIAAGFLLL
ncbi:MAG: dimethylsulfonioproprionate lyase family protein, partial [Mesorhizobium sp.]|nr:dimethylsulfonioproprionate lyase family protein [Mesorhizobium sp.]